MNQVKVKLYIHCAWWLSLYLMGVRFMHEVTGLDVNWDKVDKMIEKAIKIKTEAVK